MANFREKAIFLWTYWDISLDPKIVADRLVEGGFEAVYVHTNDGFYEASYPRLENGKYVSHVNCTDELVAELRSRGLKIYGWGAPYGVNTTAEIAMMVSQTRRYGLEGYIIDAEGTWDAQGDVISDTRKIITEYKAQCPGVPVAWCWWPLFHVPGGTGVYHARAILVEAMRWADYGMPMAYWNWQTDPTGVRFLEETVRQWREVTDKPLILAGRAYNDAYGTASYVAVLAFDRRARELGTDGITWWDLQHAVRLPECWQALKETEKMNNEPLPEEKNMYADNAIGLISSTPTWTNTAFDFHIGIAGGSWHVPNPDLKPMEEKATAEGKPFLALWNFNVDQYVRAQIPMDETRFPPPADDTQFQMFIRAISPRDVKAVILRIFDVKDENGIPAAPNYFSFAAKIFCSRAEDWVRKNKGVPFLVATSNAFIGALAPEMNNWVLNFNVMVLQNAITPLDNSFPQATDKPQYISNRPTWEMWRYTSNLVIFNGDKAALASFLQVTAPPPPPPPPPPPVTPEVSRVEFEGVLARLTVAEQERAALQQAYDGHTHRLPAGETSSPV